MNCGPVADRGPGWRHVQRPRGPGLLARPATRWPPRPRRATTPDVRTARAPLAFAHMSTSACRRAAPAAVATARTAHGTTSQTALERKRSRVTCRAWPSRTRTRRPTCPWRRSSAPMIRVASRIRASRSRRCTRARTCPRTWIWDSPGSSRTPAACTRRCTASGAGRCASTRGTPRPRSPTSATSICSRTAAPGSRWPSTCRRSSAWTPTTRAAWARWAGRAWRSTRSTTCAPRSTASRSTRSATSMTINAPAAVLLLLYELVAEEQGIESQKLKGTVQNDILKEYIARGNFIYPPEPSMRLTTDLFAYCKAEHPEVEHGQHLRLPLPREGRLGGPGGRVHAGQRHGLRAGRARRRPAGGRLRAPPGLLLQRPQQRLPGGREVPRGPQHVGARDARALRGQGPEDHSCCASTRRPAASRSPPSSR